MNVPVQIFDTVRVDLRVVFVLVGSLFGGPVGAVLTTAIAGGYRFYLGGIGMTAGVAGVIASGAIGYLFARVAKPRNNDYGFALLLAAGLANAVVAVLLVHLVFAIQHLPSLPPESEEALILISPVVTAIFGTFMAMVHPRTWRRTERLLADIVETTSELVWELGASGRFTFASERYVDVLGIPAGSIVGRTPDELGWRPVDPATERSFAEAIAVRKPFRGLVFVQMRQGGDPRLIAVTGVPVFTGQNRYVGYRGVASDVTEIERWRTLTARITDVVGTMVGDEFLHALVKTLTETLGVRSGFIGRFDHPAHMVRDINFYSDGAWKPKRDIVYDALPSGVVATGQSVIVSSGIKDRYPAMQPLRSYLGVEAYAAVPLKSARGEVLGILGAVDDKAWDSPQYVETVLTLFAGRAAAELSRTIADEEERRRQERGRRPASWKRSATWPAVSRMTSTTCWARSSASASFWWKIWRTRRSSAISPNASWVSASAAGRWCSRS
jgi:PAS domain S-box-containing protein